MTKQTRVQQLVAHMAEWSLEFQSPECHDADIVAAIGGVDVTVGTLRRAFERYYHQPFRTTQPAEEATVEVRRYG